jgi:membrane protein DedA with SNARE-associated domain/membrane-associated phospholipid phosphatase
MPWFEQITQFVADYRYLAYLLVFVVAFWESIPVFGIFVPGSTIIVAASILIPSGALELFPVLMTAILGSIAGDCGSFLMGRRYGRSLLSWGPLARREDMVARAERFFREHGGKGIIIGRFLAPIRGILPAMAGMTGITWSRFLPAAVFAALGWAPLHVLPGALIGASLHVAGAVTARLGIFVLVLLIFGYLLVLLTRALLFWGVPAGARAMRVLLIWARAHNNSIGREIVALLDPAHKEAKAIAPLAVLLILGGWGFFAILEDIVAGEALSRADASIFNGLQALRTPWGDMVMVAITELGDAKVTVPVFLAGVGWLLWRRAWIDGAYLAAAVVIAQAVAAAIKIALHTPRPIPELYQGWSAFSFPSGHATVNAVLYGFLAVMVVRETGPILRRFIAAAAALLVGLIALSRLYLGAHWFTDVAGGLGFGIAWVALLGIVYIRHRPPGGLSRGLMPVVTAVLVLGSLANIGLSHSRDLARYQPAPRLTVISAAKWITGDWARLPSHRIDLGGEYEEPFVLQLAGSPDNLRRALEPAGWHESAPWNAIGAVAWLATGSGMEMLPVVPKLHEGRLPRLMLTMREDGDRTRLVLRLWDSGFRLESANGETPIWEATITREDLHQPLGMVSLALTEKDTNGPRDLLARTIPALTRQRADPQRGDADWDGKLLLSAGG